MHKIPLGLLFVTADLARNLEGSILATIGMSTITMPIINIIITMAITVVIIVGIIVGIVLGIGSMTR